MLPLRSSSMISCDRLGLAGEQRKRLALAVVVDGEIVAVSRSATSRPPATVTVA